MEIERRVGLWYPPPRYGSSDTGVLTALLAERYNIQGVAGGGERVATSLDGNLVAS